MNTIALDTRFNSAFIHPVALRVAMASLAALGAASLLQQMLGLDLCDLCALQRWPHGVVVALGIAATLVRSRRFQGAPLLAMSLALILNASIAIFHLGSEASIWVGGLPMLQRDVVVLAIGNGIYSFVLALFAMSEGLVHLADAPRAHRGGLRGAAID